MTPSTKKLASLWLVAVIVLGLGSALLLSLFRQDRPRRHRRPLAGQAPSVPGGETQDDATVPLVKINKPPPPDNGYVGSATCAECHPKIAKSYQTHSMSNSMWEVDTAPALEDFGEKATFSPDGRHIYSVEKTAEGIKHHERLLDTEGQTLYDQAVRMEHAVGSGVHGKSYIFQREGTMFMSPISWYTPAARWNLSPGYTLPGHRRFERRVTDACLDCHVGRVNFVRGNDDHLGQPPFLELSIGCERCHGPGAEHTKYHRDSLVVGSTDPIVNPANLDPARREDICSQCHLQGQGRFPHYGCEIGDFRPGQRLEETAVIFVKGTRMTEDGKSRAVSHVEQMRSSVCYQKSNGKFGCTSCHDPHSLPAESEKLDFYRGKCLTCHQVADCSVPEPERRQQQPQDSCTVCHLPPLTASDIPHTSHTDHRVLRRPAALPDKPVDSNALPDIFDQADKRLPALAVDRARGLWLAEQSEIRTNPEFAKQALGLLTRVLRQLPDDADVLDGLGTASAVSGNLDNAIDFWKRSLALEPHRELTLRTIILSLQNSGRTDEVKPYFEAYLKAQPWSATMWGRYSHFLGVSGDWQGALAPAEKSLEIDPSQTRIYRWLSEIHKKLGDDEKSRHYAELAERLQPPKKK